MQILALNERYLLCAHLAAIHRELAVHDSTVNVVRGSTLSPLVKNVSAPADIGVDTKRNVLAVPRFNDGKVEYFKLP